LLSIKLCGDKKVTTDQNPYQAYTDGSIFSDSPLNLVVALYQGALDATRQAERAIGARDILGRGKAINKAIAILTELVVSLDHERGGEISQNLKRLYSYMQTQLLAAHARQAAEPIAEVSALLTTLLEGWRGAQQATVACEQLPAAFEQDARQSSVPPAAYASAPIYGGYSYESAPSCLSTAYSF
jgi:flagellar protein FliS